MTHGTERLMASYADLIEWAKEHGPDHLRFAAERGYAVKSGVMDTVAQKLADALGGRVVREGDRLVQWRPRKDPSAEALAQGSRVIALFGEWLDARTVPALVRFEMSGIVRVEEQPDATRPDDTLKYAGFVITVKHPATEERFVLVNLEAIAE